MKRTITPHKGNRNRHFPGTRCSQETLDTLASIIESRNHGNAGKKYTVADWIEEKVKEDSIKLSPQ